MNANARISLAGMLKVGNVSSLTVLRTSIRYKLQLGIQVTVIVRKNTHGTVGLINVKLIVLRQEPSAMDKGMKSISVDVFKDLFGTLTPLLVNVTAAYIKNQQERI